METVYDNLRKIAVPRNMRGKKGTHHIKSSCFQNIISLYIFKNHFMINMNAWKL
jgi:hypothetical protein